MINLLKDKRNSGFTLIELLVVVAIIGILSSVVLASLNSARAKARDAKRMSELREVEKALQLYYISNNGTYPSTGSAHWGICSSYNPGGTKTTSGANGYIPNLAPTYISVLPTDPNPIGTYGCYLYFSDGVDYILMAHTTVESFDPDSPVHPLDRPCCIQRSIAVYSTGGRNW